MSKTLKFPQHDYIVTVQELHETQYLVKNAVAPQQAQEWIELYINDNLSEFLGQNLKEVNTTFVTDGRNNIVERLRDIKVEKFSRKNNADDLNFIIDPDVSSMGCTCGYDEEETQITDSAWQGISEDEKLYKIQQSRIPCCPDDKCTCGYDEQETWYCNDDESLSCKCDEKLECSDDNSN